MIPFFQQLSGRNPARPSPRHPLVRDVSRIPEVSPVLDVSMRLGSDAAVELYCALVHAYPKARTEALKRGAPVYRGAGEPSAPVVLKSPLPANIAVEAVKLPDRTWEAGLYQLEEEYTLLLRPSVAEWTIGNRKVLRDTWLAGSTRHVDAPEGVPYRFKVSGLNAIQLNPPAKLVFRGVNPNKDYPALLRYLESDPQLWTLPFTEDLKQAVTAGAGNPLSAPALLADLAVEAAFINRHA